MQSARKSGSLDKNAVLAMKQGGTKLSTMLDTPSRLNVYRDEVRIRCVVALRHNSKAGGKQPEKEVCYAAQSSSSLYHDRCQ